MIIFFQKHIEWHTPQQRMTLCFVFALVAHLVFFIAFHLEPRALFASQQQMDIVLIPPMPPAPSTLSQNAATAEGGASVQSVAPRKSLVKRTVSMSNHRASDATYLQSWQQRIETVGKKHYPVEARVQGLTGSLRVVVALRKDGSVDSVKVLKSSGHAVLDNAALHIVKLASPFEALPTEIAREIDILEIIRTWEFRGTEENHEALKMLAQSVGATQA